MEKILFLNKKTIFIGISEIKTQQYVHYFLGNVQPCDLIPMLGCKLSNRGSFTLKIYLST